MLAYLLPDPEHSLAARLLLVLGYVVAALCWLRANRRARAASAESFSRWWMLGTVLLFLLAINKLFNLRLQFEAGIRALAKAGHWYDRRQPMQFVVAIVLPSVLGLFTAAPSPGAGGLVAAPALPRAPANSGVETGPALAFRDPVL
jgi:hypothetical protein